MKGIREFLISSITAIVALTMLMPGTAYAAIAPDIHNGHNSVGTVSEDINLFVRDQYGNYSEFGSGSSVASTVLPYTVTVSSSGTSATYEFNKASSQPISRTFYLMSTVSGTVGFSYTLESPGDRTEYVSVTDIVPTVDGVLTNGSFRAEAGVYHSIVLTASWERSSFTIEGADHAETFAEDYCIPRYDVHFSMGDGQCSVTNTGETVAFTGAEEIASEIEVTDATAGERSYPVEMDTSHTVTDSNGNTHPAIKFTVDNRHSVPVSNIDASYGVTLPEDTNFIIRVNIVRYTTDPSVTIGYGGSSATFSVSGTSYVGFDGTDLVVSKDMTADLIRGCAMHGTSEGVTLEISGKTGTTWGIFLGDVTLEIVLV